MPVQPRDCFRCSQNITTRQYRFTHNYDLVRDLHRVCRTCSHYYRRCDNANCRTLTDERTRVLGASYLQNRRRRWADPRLCEPCLAEHATECVSCGDFYGELYRDSMCEVCYDRYNEDEDEDSDMCSCGDPDCGEAATKFIHDYSFTPQLNFFHDPNTTLRRPEPLTPYLGMELEISLNDRKVGAELVTNAKPNYIYCKEDSSIEPRGFEMVTHPATLEAAKAHLPFTELRQLRNDHEASAWNNGIHVHVSRSGFTNNSHVYKWQKFIYRNQRDVERLARRKSRDWASFENEMRENQKYTSEKQRTRRSNNVYTNRYSAINVENEETFEVRVFRGSLRRDEILAALELVDASVEYTRQLSTNTILVADGWSWISFIQWAATQGDTYENLIALDTKLIDLPTDEEDDDEEEEILANTDMLVGHTITATTNTNNTAHMIPVSAVWQQQLNAYQSLMTTAMQTYPDIEWEEPF